MKRQDEKPALTNELSKGTATGLPVMKRPYQKPTLTDLSQPDPRAGWLTGDGKASPQAICVGGDAAGPPNYGPCQTGFSPFVNSFCSLGGGPGNVCGGGSGV
jgi:hypothetical protein